MRNKEQACRAWEDINKNCASHIENFFGLQIFVMEETLPYVQSCDEMCDRFSIATLCGDIEAIQKLYNSADLSTYQRQKIDNLLKINRDLLITLNPYILQEKYSFLETYLNELSLDAYVQDCLLSLGDYELSIIKRIVDLALNYCINSHALIATIIDHVGMSSISGRNRIKRLDEVNSFFNLVNEYEKHYSLDDNVIGNIGFAIKTKIFPKTVEDLNGYTDLIKKLLLDVIHESDDLTDLKKYLMYALFGMSEREANKFIKKFDIDGLPSELLMSEGVVEFTTIEMLLKCDDVGKLKEAALSLINDDKFEINLFNNSLVEENLLSIYANEFNKCKPVFDESNLLETVDGVKFYDSGDQFYAIVKTLGAFTNEGNHDLNYYDEWNDDRYRSHVNSLSLIRNDNLAFAEQDGMTHVKLGFCDFDTKMFLGGSISDVNSSTSSRDMSLKIYSHLCFPDKFINCTRKWHNELDYERKNTDSQALVFKKNPDFVILDQECEDISRLSIEEQQQYQNYKNDTIRAAKDFGNLPVLVINREKIAKNERKLISEMLDDYSVSHNVDLLKSIIIKFDNNRNGCRGPQHRYIRETYFSDRYFQEILYKIEKVIPENQKELFYEFVKNERKEMANCSYDDTVNEFYIESDKLSKRGGLSD